MLKQEGRIAPAKFFAARGSRQIHHTNTEGWQTKKRTAPRQNAARCNRNALEIKRRAKQQQQKESVESSGSFAHQEKRMKRQEQMRQRQRMRSGSNTRLQQCTRSDSSRRSGCNARGNSARAATAAHATATARTRQQQRNNSSTTARGRGAFANNRNATHSYFLFLALSFLPPPHSSRFLTLAPSRTFLLFFIPYYLHPISPPFPTPLPLQPLSPLKSIASRNASTRRVTQPAPRLRFIGGEWFDHSQVSPSKLNPGYTISSELPQQCTHAASLHDHSATRS